MKPLRHRSIFTHRPKSLSHPLVAGLGLTLTMAWAPAARAQAEEAPYCREVRARGASDAVLLMTPAALAQGIRFPAPDQNVVPVQQYQVRVGLTWSPVDFYKGFGTMDVADADCEQHQAQASIEELLLQADDAGRLPALHKQAAFLDAHRAEWQAAKDKEEARFTARVISLTELNEVRSRVADLERRAVQVQGEAAKLELKGYEQPKMTVPALEAKYLEKVNRYEQEVAHVRSIQPWQLKLTGGAVPSNSPVDWFGLVELSINLGIFSHNHLDDVYVKAREEEVKSAHYEVAQRLHGFRKQLENAIAEARRELAIVQKEVDLITSTRKTLEGSDVPNVAHAVATLTLDQITVQADAIYLSTLVDELTSYLGDKKD